MSYARPLYPGYLPGTSMAPGSYATSMWQVGKLSFKIGARKIAYALGYVGPPISSNPTKVRQAAAAAYMMVI